MKCAISPAKPSRRIPSTLFLGSLCLLLFPLPAHAYIDPNASGLISQLLTPMLIMGAAGVTFLRKRMSAAFTGLVRRLRGRADA